MHLEPDDLLAQLQQDFPRELELVRLRVLVRLQDEEIQRLKAAQAGSLFQSRGYTTANDSLAPGLMETGHHAG